MSPNLEADTVKLKKSVRKARQLLALQWLRELPADAFDVLNENAFEALAPLSGT